jgi:hypothetical protein
VQNLLSKKGKRKLRFRKYDTTEDIWAQDGQNNRNWKGFMCTPQQKIFFRNVGKFEVWVKCGAYGSVYECIVTLKKYMKKDNL